MGDKKKRTAVIMQPTYLPWCGYFDMMDQSDVFIFLDDVQFDKRSWQQRNRIRTPKGLEWITVPVKVKGRYSQLIKDVEIADIDFYRRHIRAFEHNYSKAPFFRDFKGPFFKELERRHGLLAELNCNLIIQIARGIGIKCSFLRSSYLNVRGKKAERLLELCQRVGASRYLSPVGSAGYLLDAKDRFSASGIEIFFHNYVHPSYQQVYNPFMPFACILDLIFNCGPDSLELIRSGRRSPLPANDFRENR